MPKRRSAVRHPAENTKPSASKVAGAQSSLLGSSGLAAWERNSSALIADLLSRGVAPRFLIQWFSVFEAVERGDPLLIGMISAAAEGLRRPDGLPRGALECCCCERRWSAAAGPALAVRVELLDPPADFPVVVGGMTCLGCYVRIARDREAAERALIASWFPGLSATSLTVANEDPGPWKVKH